MEAAQALADLTEISAQIEAAVLAGTDGSVLASTFTEPSRGAELAKAALELVAAADEAPDGGQELVQLEAATPRGSVFVVRDPNHVVAAITAPKPTVGLIFYDLKTCLRMLERKEAGAAKVAEAPAKVEKPSPSATKEAKVGKATSTRRRAPAKKEEETDGGG
jgi:predicted regulator of Ras-like GTPase activity (Roadblock/LC7/MglB family)